MNPPSLFPARAGWVAPLLVFLASLSIDPMATAAVSAALPDGAQTTSSAAAVQNRSSAALHIASDLTLYSIGDPTDEEQLYLEYVNRARKDPAAEGLRLQAVTETNVLRNYQAYGVDLALMQSQLASIPPAPPLSMNPLLIAAARGHSQDMLAHEFQGHNGTDGSAFTNRLTAAGYTWNAAGENVFSYAKSVEEGHDGFEADWGGDASSGGMQNPPDHRLNIHNPNFVEVGVGVILGTNGTVGPQVVTEDFGRRPGVSPFITGVIYYDLNANGAYDLGEGIGGVGVLAQGSTYYGLTVNSGGYSVPVPTDGNYPVTVSVPGLADAHFSVPVTGGQNVKLDYALAYVPPVISGSDQPAVAQGNLYSFSAVPGATGYQWKMDFYVANTSVEGAEDGLVNVTVNSSPGYAVLDNIIQASGNNSFHLAHLGTPTTQAQDQVLTLNSTFRAKSGVQMTFASRLGWATTNQVAHAQISLDAGQTWLDVWTQAGTGDAGELNFTERTVDLPINADQLFQVRFLYAVTGTYFFQTDPGVGLYLDDIAVHNADRLEAESISTGASGTSFSFTPDQAGEFTLRVRPQVSGRFLAWGPEKVLTAQIGTASNPVVRITAAQQLQDGRMQIDFTVSGSNPSGFIVQRAPAPMGPWNEETTASIQAGQAGAFRALIPMNPAPQGFFRVGAN